MPYIKGNSEAIKRTFCNYGVKVAFKDTQTLRQLLVAPKDKTEKKDVASPCTESFIGETERSLKTRFLEHRRPSSTSSEVSQHIHIESPGHYVDLDQVKVLDRELRFFWERCWRGHLHLSQQAITQHGKGADIQVTQSVRPDFGVTCQKGHWLLIWVASLQTNVEGSTENSRYVENLCWDHKLKSHIY